MKLKTVEPAIMGRASFQLFLVLFMVVGTELCLASTLAWSSSRKTAEDKSSRVAMEHRDYPTVTLTTVGFSAEGYKAFIAGIRERLRSSKEKYGIPLLQSRGDVPDYELRLLVTLSNSAGETITLEMDATNASLVGYHAQGGDSIHPGFILSYPDLERVARLRRQEIELGAKALEESISALSWAAAHPSRLLDHSVARAILVLSQMVSEAVRFRYIENELGVIIQDNVHSAPDPSVIQLEDSWKSLSREIQGSNQGMFRRPVRLQRRDGSWFQVFSVQSIATSISLMNVACKSSSSSDSLFHSQLKLSPLIRLATSSSEQPSDDDVDYCPVDVEPTLQIVGPGGMCLAPRDGQYNNGNPIELTPCRSSPEQLWTFRRDGTIRSQAGNCMAAYGRSTGNDNYIMIYDCDPKVDVFRWRVWANGTIASDSGLVLSAASPSGSGAVSAQLTLEENTYSPAQSWLPTNNTAPYMARFVGIFRFCLQASLDDVLVAAACVPAAEDQAWFMYPDGSMRPQGKLTRCIAAVDAQLLKIVDCDAASSQQRWQLATDGTIVNPASQLVMDVKGYVRSGLRIFLNSPQGTTSQKWFQAIHP